MVAAKPILKIFFEFFCAVVAERERDATAARLVAQNNQ